MYRWCLIDVCDMCLRHQQLQPITLSCTSSIVDHMVKCIRGKNLILFTFPFRSIYKMRMQRRSIIHCGDSHRKCDTIAIGCKPKSCSKYNVFNLKKPKNTRAIALRIRIVSVDWCDPDVSICCGRHSVRVRSVSTKREHIRGSDTIETQCQLNPWHAISYFFLLCGMSRKVVVAAASSTKQNACARVAGKD